MPPGATLMKLSELNYFSEFLSVLFDFFKEYRIVSSAEPLDDIEGLRDRLLGADLVAFTYLSNIRKYSMEIMFDTPPDKDEIYTFLWGAVDSKKINEFLVDIGANLAFLHVEIIAEKYPVFVRDFLTGRGELRASCFGEDDMMIPLDDASIMSMDEFRQFLAGNAAQKDYTIIGVE